MLGIVLHTGGASVNKIVKSPYPHRGRWTTHSCKSSECCILGGEQAMKTTTITTTTKNRAKGIMYTGGMWVAI